MTMNIHTMKLLTQTSVCELLTISKTTLWRIEKQDTTFPQKVNLGGRRIAYKQHEIIEWIENR
jgi:prophage regulatory protein